MWIRLVQGRHAYSCKVEASPVTNANRPRLIPNGRSLNPRHLGKRAITGVSCGGFSTASPGDTSTNMANLNSGEATVSANSCNRIGCYNTSGVYICNDQAVDITIAITDATTITNYIYETCISNGEGLSGQMFTDANGGYNVVIAFCDGNLSPSTPPSAYTPPGPNGGPAVVCGGNNQNPCSFGTCDTTTIVVASQGVVTCNEYLGPAYIGAGARKLIF